MKKILVLGDYTLATWHPLTGVDEALKGILSDYELTITEDYAGLSAQELAKYDVVINYIDAWGKRGSSDLAGAFLQYVSGGGAMLALHNGIIARNTPEMEQLIGGRFLGHPQQRMLTYTVKDVHPISKNLPEFSIDEEPYQFELDNLVKPVMLLTYKLEDKDCPAAWVRSFGKGKVVFLSMGHSYKSFASEGFCELIRRSVLFCCGGPML